MILYRFHVSANIIKRFYVPLRKVHFKNSVIPSLSHTHVAGSASVRAASIFRGLILRQAQDDGSLGERFSQRPPIWSCSINERTGLNLDFLYDSRMMHIAQRGNLSGKEDLVWNYTAAKLQDAL